MYQSKYESMTNPFAIIDARLTSIETLLSEIRCANAPAKPTPSHGEEYMTVKEAAEFLDLSVSTVYILVHKRQIPFYKPEGSNRVYFSKEEMTKYIKSGRQKTVGELSNEAITKAPKENRPAPPDPHRKMKLIPPMEEARQ